jgi:membrane associated rhomboid family serine protease
LIRAHPRGYSSGVRQPGFWRFMDLLVQFDRFLSRHLSPAVKTIFLINCGVFIFFMFARLFPGFGEGYSFADNVALALANTPRLALGRFMIWQFVTYMFVHFDPFHLLFNMLVLWFFAPSLERRWGTLRFWNFYLVVGAGAGFFYALFTVFSGGAHIPVIGASGALYGVMLAFAAYYPNARVYVWGIFPIAIKYLVGIVVLFDFMSALSQRATGISYLTHLCGFAIAFLYLARYHRTSDITRWRYLR